MASSEDKPHKSQSMAVVSDELLLDVSFYRGKVETLYDEALAPANVRMHGSAVPGKKTRPYTPFPPTLVPGFEYASLHQLDFGRNASNKYLTVPALPILQCDFTVAAWVNLPHGLREARIFVLSNWTYPWSYFLGLRVDDRGRVAATGELRRNINSAGSDPQQGMATVDSANGAYFDAGQQAFPWAAKPVIAGAQALQGGVARRGGGPLHVAWTWQREEGRLSAWLNGVCVASHVTPWEDHDVQFNDRRTHDVGFKRDGGPCWMKGGLLQLQVLRGAAVQPGALNATMRGVWGRMSYRRRRCMLLHRLTARNAAKGGHQ